MHIYIFSLLTTGFSNHKSFYVWLSGKLCVLALSILISALTPSLLKQTRTDSPLSSWFLFPFCHSHGNKDHTGNTLHPGKRKYSLKRQTWLKVCLNNTRNYKKNWKIKYTVVVYIMLTYQYFCTSIAAAGSLIALHICSGITRPLAVVLSSWRQYKPCCWLQGSRTLF